jgi:hypothetical protein
VPSMEDIDRTGTSATRRRSLIRAGVWATPVVSLAAAAPALAASCGSGPADLSTSTWPSTSRSGTTVTTQFILHNTGAVTAGLTLTVSTGSKLDSVSALGTTVNAPSGGSTSLILTLPLQVACEGQLVVTVTLKLHANSPSQTVHYAFAATGATGYTVAIAS